MQHMTLLGIVGPWQIMLLSVPLLGIVGLIIVLAMNNSKNKAKASTLDQIRREQQQAPKQNNLAKIQELGELRDKGLLTEEEFAQEKKKVLGV